MKRLTVALLVFSVFAPTVFAQSVEFEQADRRRIFSGWLEIVKGAERDYKNKNGRYGDLAALRNAHLLDRLVFESGSSAAARSKAQANFVPESTLFRVTVSTDGQHFRAVIGEKCVSVSADEMGRGLDWLCGPSLSPRDFEDSPEGPIFAR